MLRDVFIEHGFPARRGQQFSGGTDSPDVVVPDLPEYHIECKFVEKLDLEAAMAQATKDAGSEKIPIVFHKKKGKDWLVTFSVEDFFELIIKLHDDKQHRCSCSDHGSEAEQSDCQNPPNPLG